MDDDRMHAHLAQEHHVFGEALFEMLVDHGVAAVFDDDSLPGELLKPRKRFDEYFGFLIRPQVGVYVQVVSRAFQFTHAVLSIGSGMPCLG